MVTGVVTAQGKPQKFAIPLLGASPTIPVRIVRGATVQPVSVLYCANVDGPPKLDQIVEAPFTVAFVPWRLAL